MKRVYLQFFNALAAVSDTTKSSPEIKVKRIPYKFPLNSSLILATQDPHSQAILLRIIL